MENPFKWIENPKGEENGRGVGEKAGAICKKKDNYFFRHRDTKAKQNHSLIEAPVIKANLTS